MRARINAERITQMNLAGGYFMLDGGGLDLTTGSTPVTISGIYDRCKTAINSPKEIVAYNLKYATKNVSPVPCFGWQIADDEIVLVSATIHVHVKSTDAVTTIDVVSSINNREAKRGDK